MIRNRPVRNQFGCAVSLYIEARPQTGFAPMNAEAYRTGYSLELLRDLALVPLETDEDKNGHFISDTIDTLFRVVFEGTPASQMPEQAKLEVFTFAPVRARLFDPEAIGEYRAAFPKLGDAADRRTAVLVAREPRAEPRTHFLREPRHLATRLLKRIAALVSPASLPPRI